jgi:hypothetical protein
MGDKMSRSVAALSTNRYGLDANYFSEKLQLILRDLDNYKPDEMARSLSRLAIVADENVLQEPEFKFSHWRDVAIHGLPDNNQEVLMVRDNKTVWGAWLGDSFWCGGKRCAALYWMPMPEPQK